VVSLSPVLGGGTTEDLSSVRDKTVGWRWCCGDKSVWAGGGIVGGRHDDPCKQRTSVVGDGVYNWGVFKPQLGKKSRLDVLA